MNTKKSNTYIYKKAFVNLLVIAIGAILTAVTLTTIQRITVRERVQNEGQQILAKISDTLEKNREEAETLTRIYHTLNQSTTTDLKEILLNGLLDSMIESADSEKIAVISDIVRAEKVPYLFLVDSDGTIVAGDPERFIGDNLIEGQIISGENFDQLIQSGEETRWVKEIKDDGSYYFYSDVVDTSAGTYYLIFGTDADILDSQLEVLCDVTRVIQNIEIGESGFIFAVDKTDNSFIHFEDKMLSLTGMNALEAGLTEEALTDTFSGEQTINNTTYYCVSRDCGNCTIVVAASDLEKLYEKSGNAWKWSIAGFVAIALLCLMYATFVRNDHFFKKRETRKLTLFKWKDQEIYLNYTVFHRIFPVILLGILLIFGISFYSCTILDISKAISDSETNISELENNLADANVTKEIVMGYYEDLYLSKARILSFLFEENPSVLNENRNKEYFEYDSSNTRVPVLDDEGNTLMAVSESEQLWMYCSSNDIFSIYLFDEQGRTIATNQPDWYFRLSFDENDQSYPFREVLEQRLDHYIQEKGVDESGRNSQYLGTSFSYYTTTDEKGDTLYVSRYDYYQYQQGLWEGNPITKHNSLLKIALAIDTMDDILSTTEYQFLLEKSTINSSYLVILDNTDEHKVVYSPREESIGKTAAEIGLGENAFSGDYIGFQKANGQEYLLDIEYHEGYYIGNAVLVTNLYNGRFRTALITAGLGAVFIILMSLLITLSSKKEEKIYAEERVAPQLLPDSIMFLISTPAGNQSMTEKAASRWDNKNIPWRERTPEQKLTKVFFIVTALSILNILLFTYMVGKGKVEDSIIAFILSGNWDREVNVFSISACALVLIGALVAAELLNIPIRLVTSIFGTKGETVGHLLASVIKYVATIYSIFYCFYLIGFDSTSLMTSAGILSLVIGLGSQSLIRDVVAGIFIIFEGEFRVGDIVTIGGYRGQVLDVGLRTTKIMAADHNIKIINNNDVNGVINMTRVASLCSITVPITNVTDVDEFEAFLERELPGVKDRVDGIMDGPYYNGIVAFDQKNFTIEISALCKEKNIIAVKAGLNREIMELVRSDSFK